MTTDEPIGRLYRFLDYCAGRADGNTCRQVWTMYVNLPDKFTPEFWRSVAVVTELPSRARATLGRYSGPLDVDDVLKEIDRAERAINAAAATPDQTIGVMKAGYDRGTVQTLKLAASVVGPSAGEPQLADDAREEIRAAATDLIDVLRRDDSIPVEVKRLLLEHAEAVLHALNLLEVAGARMVLDERDRLIGVLATAPAIQSAVAKEPTIREKLGRLLVTLTAIGTLTHTLLQLPRDVSDVLELTTSTITTIAPGPVDAEPGDVA